jgi:hypothetical protein
VDLTFGLALSNLKVIWGSTVLHDIKTPIPNSIYSILVTTEDNWLWYHKVRTCYIIQAFHNYYLKTENLLQTTREMTGKKCKTSIRAGSFVWCGLKDARKLAASVGLSLLCRKQWHAHNAANFLCCKTMCTTTECSVIFELPMF